MKERHSDNNGVGVSNSLGESAARGAVWIYGRMLAVQLIRFVAIVVLARELEIRAFGIVALANVALMLFSVLASQGVNQFIVYDRDNEFEDRVSAAFWLNVLISLMAVVVGFAVAPAIARAFNEPLLVPILQVLLLRFPLDSMTRVLDAVRNKALQFRTIEIRDTSIELGIAIGSIGMALAGFGVWSLVVPAVLLAPVQTIVAVLTTKWRPGWRPGLRHWPRILRYSVHIIGSSFTSFVLTHGDTLLVGRLLGSGLLGIYNLAWQTSNLVSKNIVNLGSKLFFPMLAAVSEDRERTTAVLKRLLRILSGLAFPALVGLFVVADDFIVVVYGEKWAEAVLPLRILIIYALRYSVGSPLGPVLKALGRPDLIFKLGIVTSPFYCVAIWLGAAQGIVGVALGVTVVRTAFGGLTFVIVARQLQVATTQLVAPILPALGAAILMGLSVYIAELGWDAANWGVGVAKLVVLVATGILSFLASIRYLFRELAFEFVALTRQVLGRQVPLINKVLKVSV